MHPPPVPTAAEVDTDRPVDPAPEPAAADAAASSPALTDGELLRIWSAFRGGVPTDDDRLVAAVAALPVPPQIVETLALLVATPTRRLTLTRLAAQLEVSADVLTTIVDRLVRDDLAHRQPGRGVQPVAFAVLTDRGGQVLSETLPLYAAPLRAELERLPADRLAELRAVCRDLVTGGADRG